MNSVPLLRWAGNRELVRLDLAAFESGQWINVSCNYNKYWQFRGMHIKHSAVYNISYCLPLLFIHPIVTPSPFLHDSFSHWNRRGVFHSKQSLHTKGIHINFIICFWCFTWGTHSLWAYHTTVWWNGVWWVVMSVRQLRVTASDWWSRETILVLYMSG